MENERGKHRDPDKMKSVILWEILKGSQSRSEILWNLKSTKYATTRRNLNYHFKDRNNKGLVDMGVISEKDHTIRLRKNMESLTNIVQILLKHPAQGKRIKRNLGEWLSVVYESDYGDLTVYGTTWDDLVNFEGPYWKTLMERTRGEYDLRFALSYLVRGIHAHNVYQEDMRGDPKEIGSFSAYNLTLYSNESIRDMKGSIFGPAIDFVIREMVLSGNSLEIDESYSDEYSTYLKESEMGRFYHVIDLLMNANLSKAVKITDRIEADLEEEVLRIKGGDYLDDTMLREYLS